MIPPMQGLRTRSINRWLKDSRADFAMLPPAERSKIATDLDDLMIETFEDQDDALMARLMKSHLWGTEAGYQQYNLDRMVIWQDVCSEFLPTFDREQET